MVNWLGGAAKPPATADVPPLRMTPAVRAVLRVLAGVGDDTLLHGLEVGRRAGVPVGTLYPLLRRLEGAGLARGWWGDADGRPGPRRRYYELTPAGRELAEKNQSDDGEPMT